MQEEQAAGRSALGSKLLLVLLDNKEKRYDLEKRIGSELKGGRKKVLAELRALEAHGLVRFAADAGEEPALKGARAVEITGAGEEYVLRELEVNPGCVVKGAAFSGALKALRKRLLEAERRAAGGATPAAHAPPPPRSGGDLPLGQVIVRAFLDREVDQRGYVPIHEVRRLIPGASREAFDATLLDLQADGVLYLNKLNDARGIPEDQIRDGLLDPVRGRLFFISRGERL